jgi:apolipoprotein N-acyltransferase
MGSGRARSNYESFTVAYVLFSFAIALLIAWGIDDWILFIPVFLIEVGIGYLVLGFVIRPRELHKRPVMRDAYYYVLWGSISALIGIEWLMNRQYPGNVPLLIALFIIWMGVISAGLAIGRNRERAGVPKQ